MITLGCGNQAGGPGRNAPAASDRQEIVRRP